MQFDSIVLAPGFDLYDPTEKREFGYGTLEGVLTGIEFERICSVTGPTGGEMIWKGKKPKRFYLYPVRRVEGQTERGPFLLAGMLHVHGETC